MTSQKVVKNPLSSFPRTRESSKINQFWTPASAGVTALETFYETIKLETWNSGRWRRSFL